MKCKTILVASLVMLLMLQPTITYSTPEIIEPDIIIVSAIQLPKIDMERDMEVACLAKNIYHEARGESLLGQKAVASVVFNRMRSKNFPSTVCENVYMKSKTSCAFSWTCDKNKDEVYDEKTFASILELSYTMYDNFLQKKKYDYTSGSTYYHHFGVTPSWVVEMIPIMSIGDHNFYKRKANKSI